VPGRPKRGQFEDLMLPHLDAAYNLACWLLRDAHEAEDAVRDAYLKAYEARNIVAAAVPPGC
jgi:DNA-directed RNA polymerase specialized sigma24 family protein